MALTPDIGLVMISEITGKKDASVFPPAVGAITIEFFPARIASPANSWTGLSVVHPRTFTICCCNLG